MVSGFILNRHWKSVLRLVVYLAIRLVVTSLLVHVFGLVPTPLLAAGVGPQPGISVELVHASVHAIIKTGQLIYLRISEF